MITTLTEKQRDDIDIAHKLIRKDFDKVRKIKEENLQKEKSKSKDLQLP
jgi:hypothetical protein